MGLMGGKTHNDFEQLDISVRSAVSVKLEIPDLTHQSLWQLSGGKQLRNERGLTRVSRAKFHFVTQEQQSSQ